MPCSSLPIVPDNPNEVEVWTVEQELKARLTAFQISLRPAERVRPIHIQLAPISFLPNEILIQIFQYGLNEVLHSAHALPLPVAVASVCKSWRAVALHTSGLWTQVFVTAAMPSDCLQTYLERSGSFEVDASICHWSAPEHAQEINSSEAFLRSSIFVLQCHAHRLRSLSLWGVSDAVVCTVMKGFLNSYMPRLTSVSVKANQSTYNHYYQSRDLYLLPFLSGAAPSLTHLDIDHFPIETFRMPFNARNLTSLTLRTQEWPALDYSLPPYLIEFTAFCVFLQSAPNLITLALYGPVIEPDEDILIRPSRVALPALETLIIHRRDPGVRYHCELLGILYTPALKRLEIPWHDDLTFELAYANRTEEYLFDSKGRPRFASVRELYLHDSVSRWKLPARSFMKAFPNLEEVVLGGTDVAKFAATLRGFVCCADPDSEPEGVLVDGAWQTVRRVVLKEPEMALWKGWMRGFCKWLAAGGHTGQLCVEIQDGVLQEGEMDGRGFMAFSRGLDRLRKHARVVVV